MTWLQPGTFVGTLPKKTINPFSQNDNYVICNGLLGMDRYQGVRLAKDEDYKRYEKENNLTKVHYAHSRDFQSLSHTLRDTFDPQVLRHQETYANRLLEMEDAYFLRSRQTGFYSVTGRTPIFRPTTTNSLVVETIQDDDPRINATMTVKNGLQIQYGPPSKTRGGKYKKY